MELAELVADVEDITDPSCMEKLINYQEQIQAEDDDFIQLIIDRIKYEEITWPQPWYQKTRSLTRPVDTVGENDSETYQSDSFTKEENYILAKNWKKFRKMFNVPNKPESFARWRNKNKSRNPITDVEKARHFVTAFLAQGLERNLYQVYQHFVTIYAAPVKGHYSEVEEKIMKICFYHKPSNAVPFVATILGREPRGISKRLHFSNKGKSEKKKLRWSLPLATKLLQSLMQHSELPLSKLKYATLKTSVWLKVQEDMNHDYRYLQKFWYIFLHVQLFIKHDVKLQHLRKKILKRLKKSSYSIWADIRWKEVLKTFPDGFTHGFLYHAVHSLVITYPGNYRADSLRDVIEYAMNKLKKIRKRNKRKERRLRTLALDNNGNLEIVKYGEELP